MKVLLIYPHGLGDCLMLTPCLREKFENTGNKFSVCIQKRLESSQIFKHNPYVDKVFYTKDPWNDFSNSQVGFNQVVKSAQQIGVNNGYNNILYLPCKSSIHKINQNAIDLDMKLRDTSMDIFTTDKDKELAKEVIKNLVGDNEFGFIQTKTGAGRTKDLPNGYGEKWLRKNRGLTNFIEVGKDFHSLDYNLNIQFEILRLSKAVCLPDSVFYHACIAMDKDVDLVYFGRGKGVYNRVGNLNPKIKETVKYNL